MAEGGELTERNGCRDNFEAITSSWQTRDPDTMERSREDGCVKSRLFPNGFNRSLWKTKLAVSSHDRNNHPERDHIAIAIDQHTAFLHADIDQDLVAEPPEESELCEDDARKLHKALYCCRKAPQIVTPTCCDSIGSLNLSPLFTDPSCCRRVEMDIHVFFHVCVAIFWLKVFHLRVTVSTCCLCFGNSHLLTHGCR